MRGIKRLLPLVLAFLFTGYLNGYSQVCPTGNLTTNPYICGTYGDANGVSNWDWEASAGNSQAEKDKFCLTWQARTQTGNILTVMGSPFVNSPTAALHLIAQTNDYTRNKGWELLRRNFGCSTEVAYPYFVLYNKFSGLMRVYFYQPAPRPQYNRVVVQMEPLGLQRWPATTSLGDPLVIAPDQFKNSNEFGKIVLAVSETSGSAGWSVAEFNVAFDPNIQESTYNGAALKFTIFGEANSTITASIRGRSITGTEPAIYDFNYAPATPSETSSDGTINWKTKGEKFTKFGKTLTDARDGVYKAADNIVNSLANVPYDQGMKGRIKSLAWTARELSSTDGGFGKMLGQIGSAIGGAGQVLNIIGGIIGFFSDGTKGPAAPPTYTSYDLTLNGSITARNVSQTFILSIPGTNLIDGNNATYYKCPLGIFNIKNTPEADKVTYERNMSIQISPDIVNFDSYRMRNNLGVTYNSGAGVELVSVQAAIVGEVMAEDDADKNAVYDLLADHEFPKSNLMLPDLQAGFLEITSYDPVKKLHTFQTPYVNLECLSGLAFNARAETNIFLRVRAILKKKNDPDNIPIYFIRDYKIETVDGEFDEELRNRHKTFYSRSTPTPYSNYAELPVWIEDQLINNHHYTGYTEEKVDNIITAEGNVLVTTGAEVIFKAGYEVELNPGFEADYGSNFEATLKISEVTRPCGTPVVTPYQYSGNCYNTAAKALRTTTEQNSTGNATTSVEEIKVYPVPTNGKLMISGITDNSNAKISILDQSGRTVREVQSASYESAGRIDLDVSALSNGVYFVKIQTLTQTITKKIVVTK